MQDRDYMQYAIQLARKGRFTTSPNPNVGCVIVKEGNIVGEGFHQKAGDAHAEVHALKMAGENAINATAYVTLEPCAHYGKTPPCANALIDAGIKRVVIAMRDPNPLVAGKGIQLLQNAGIKVDVGLLQEEAEKLNCGFLKRMRTGLPFVRLKLAASLDGRTAMKSGESKWITGEIARQDVQVFRAQSDAILSTSQTVITDDPRLTVRFTDLPDEIKRDYKFEDLRQPIRVILDSHARLKNSAEFQLFSEPSKIILVRTEKSQQFIQTGLIEEMIAGQCDQIDLHKMLKQLAEKGINSIWVEAGAKLAGALIQHDLVDELIVYLAPKLLGNEAKGLCELSGLTTLNEALNFEFINIKKIGNDLRMILRKEA